MKKCKKCKSKIDMQTAFCVDGVWYCDRCAGYCDYCGESRLLKDLETLSNDTQICDDCKRSKK